MSGFGNATSTPIIQSAISSRPATSVSKGSNADAIDAGLGDWYSHRLEIDAARCFEQNAGLRLDAPQYRFAHHGRRHVVEQYPRSGRPASASSNCSSVSTSIWIGSVSASLLMRGCLRAFWMMSGRLVAKSARAAKARWLSLDEDAVEQTNAVIVSAALPNRVLRQQPPARDRFARVKNLGRRTGDGIDIAARERGDAAQVLHEVESQKNPVRRTGADSSARFTVANTVFASHQCAILDQGIGRETPATVVRTPARPPTTPR